MRGRCGDRERSSIAGLTAIWIAAFLAAPALADETGTSALDRSADLAQSKYGWREESGAALTRPAINGSSTRE